MLKLDQHEMIALVAARLRALGDENRIRLLLALQNGEQSVNALVAALGIAQASVSKHLGVLRAAGLVQARREANQVFYAIHDARVFDMCSIVCEGVIKNLQQQQSVLKSLKSSSRKGRAA